MSTISRRAFLKTVGVGALSVAAVSVLAGCDAVKLPGNTEEVVTGSVKAQFDQSYVVGQYVVTTEAETTAVDYTATWEEKFLSEYKTALAAEDEDAKQTAIDAADKEADGGDLVKVTVKVANTTENNLVFATTTIVAPANYKAVKSNTSVFSATANGQSLACAARLTTGAPVIAPTAASVDGTEVECYIAAPSNVKEITLNVTLGGKTLSYTIENEDYIDLSKL